jgi:hypothetical protein
VKAAEVWLEAKSETDREAIFEETGVRYSELLRLEYWRVITLTVVDTMHIFGQGCIPRHIRNVWGMDVNIKDGDGITYDIDPTAVDDEDMSTAYDVLRTGSQSKVTKLSTTVLRQLCRELNLRYGGRRKKLIRRLHDYVSSRFALPDRTRSPDTPSI